MADSPELTGTPCRTALRLWSRLPCRMWSSPRLCLPGDEIPLNGLQPGSVLSRGTCRWSMASPVPRGIGVALDSDSGRAFATTAGVLRHCMIPQSPATICIDWKWLHLETCAGQMMKFVWKTWEKDMSHERPVLYSTLVWHCHAEPLFCMNGSVVPGWLRRGHRHETNCRFLQGAVERENFWCSPVLNLPTV